MAEDLVPEMAFQESLSACQQLRAPLSVSPPSPLPPPPPWAEGHLVARGLTSQAIAGNASAPPIVGGQEAGFVFQAGNKTRTPC